MVFTSRNTKDLFKYNDNIISMPWMPNSFHDIYDTSSYSQLNQWFSTNTRSIHFKVPVNYSWYWLQDESENKGFSSLLSWFNGNVIGHVTRLIYCRVEGTNYHHAYFIHKLNYLERYTSHLLRIRLKSHLTFLFGIQQINFTGFIIYICLPR